MLYLSNAPLTFHKEWSVYVHIKLTHKVHFVRISSFRLYGTLHKDRRHFLLKGKIDLCEVHREIMPLGIAAVL